MSPKAALTLYCSDPGFAIQPSRLPGSPSPGGKIKKGRCRRLLSALARFGQIREECSMPASMSTGMMRPGTRLVQGAPVCSRTGRAIQMSAPEHEGGFNARMNQVCHCNAALVFKDCAPVFSRAAGYRRWSRADPAASFRMPVEINPSQPVKLKSLYLSSK